MNPRGDTELELKEVLERTLNQIMRFLRLEGVVFYWYVPDFNMLWPMLQCGKLHGRVPAITSYSQFVGRAFNSKVPIVTGSANMEENGDSWLFAEEAQTLLTFPLSVGGEKRGVLIGVSRQFINITLEMLRPLTIFSSQLTSIMRRTPLYVTTDIQRYLITDLTNIIGEATRDNILDESMIYEKIAHHAGLLTGAHRIFFTRSHKAYTFTTGYEKTRKYRLFTFLPKQWCRRTMKSRTTVIRRVLPYYGLTFGLLWFDSFQPTPQFQKFVDLIAHTLAAMDSLRARLSTAERERWAQYISDVSKALSVSLDISVVFEQIQKLFVPEVADCLTVEISNPDDYFGKQISMPTLNADQRHLEEVLYSDSAIDELIQDGCVCKRFNAETEKDLIEIVIVPMIMEGRTIGRLFFGRSTLRGYATKKNCTLYNELATHAASALSNATIFFNERATADILQHALLSISLPTDRRILFDASYVSTGVRSSIGGDWYDVFALDNDRFSISIGDVGGHGVNAAMTMNVVRLAFRAAALEKIDPVRVLKRGEAMLELEKNPPLVTAIYGILDLRLNVFSYVSAGHPAPRLAKNDGTIQSLPTMGLPLGIGFSSHERERFDVALTPGETLVLFTDGLVEYGHDMLAGERRCHALLKKLMMEGPRATLARDLHGMTFQEGFAQLDDVTIFTISMKPRERTMQWRMPMVSSSAPALRSVLRNFWAETPFSERESFAFLVATGEAIAESIEEAKSHAKKSAVMSVRASYNEKDVSVEVSSHGHYDDGNGSTVRGNGRTIMNALADKVIFVEGDEGNLVRLSFR